MVDSNGEISLTGLRQVIDMRQDGRVRTSVFSLVGNKIEWTAPEVMAQKANFSEMIDIYSFGITALELGYNSTPYDEWPPLKVWVIY